LLGMSTNVKGLRGVPCTIFPWYEEGNLEQALRKSQHRARISQWASELVSGILYLHNRPSPIVHGDIKAANILIDDDWHVRIADFGTSRIVTSTGTAPSDEWASNVAGSFRWMAPEHFSPEKCFCLSLATDIWALGCTLYEMYEGKFPYHQISDMLAMDDISRYKITLALQTGIPPSSRRPEKPESRTTMPIAMWDVVQSCWTFTPDRRPSITDVATKLSLVQ